MHVLSHPGRIGLAILIGLIAALLWQAQALAQGPVEEQVAWGAQLYADNCAVCHGPNGEGRIGATLAKDWPSIQPDLRVRTTIERGVPGSPMPAWGEAYGGPLGDEEIDALTLYILSWETGGLSLASPTPTFTPRPPITPVAEVEGDPNRGAVLYAENCTMCHGSQGEGRVGARLAKAWPAIRPDLYIKGTIERGVLGTPMPAWSQAYGGPLTDDEINDIVAFVMSWTEPASQALDSTPTPAPARSAFSGPLGALVIALALLALVVIGVAGALTRRE